MDWGAAYRQNAEAYHRLKGEIPRAYPPGRFVAIHDGRLAADAASVGELDTKLLAAGKDPRESLVVEVGVKYPDYITILGLGVE